MRQKIGGIILSILIVFLVSISVSYRLRAINTENRLIRLSAVTLGAIDLSDKAIEIASEWERLCYRLDSIKAQEFQKELIKKYFSGDESSEENEEGEEMPFFDSSDTKKKAAI